MTKVLVCGALLAIASAAPAQDKAAAKEPSEKQKMQQARMKDCNARVGERKGEERQKWMSACLKGEEMSAAPKQQAQQNRMKECNRQAGEKKLKGEERKSFMSGCLKG